MKCPRCVQPVAPGLPQCVRCGFLLSTLDDEFGEDVILLERLTDAANCLRVRERDSLNALLDEFEREFPQLFTAIYFGMLPEMTSIRQFGFWLVNHAALASVDISRPNEQGILIVVDLQSRVIGVTLGYMLERFLTEKDLNRCIRAARAPLCAGDYARGTTVLLKHVSRTLRKVSRQARRNPERFAPPVMPRIGKPLFTKLKDAVPSHPPVNASPDDSFDAIAAQRVDLGFKKPEFDENGAPY